MKKELYSINAFLYLLVTLFCITGYTETTIASEIPSHIQTDSQFHYDIQDWLQKDSLHRLTSESITNSNIYRSFHNQFKSLKQWAGPDSHLPDNGDWIFYDYNEDSLADHIDIVEYVADGTIYTIGEGAHPLFAGHILGYGIPREATQNTSDINHRNAVEYQYGELLGNFKLTYYCGCSQCNGKWAGTTAIGVSPEQGRTIAVDPRIIPYHSKVIINGHVFTAEDCGSGIRGNEIDIFIADHALCYELGVDYADVYAYNE